MTISELISRLDALRTKHGDLDVQVNGYEILNVGYDDDFNFIDIEG